MNDEIPASVQEQQFRLMYRSRDLIAPQDRKVALGDLFSQARSKNKKQQISGALLISEDWFVQTLEGEETAVRALYNKIKSDPRHDCVALLAAETVGERVFGRWSMARVSNDLDEPDTFLLAHRDGISPAASLRPTTAQESVLDIMRAVARGGSNFELPQPAFATAQSNSEPNRIGSRGALSM